MKFRGVITFAILFLAGALAAGLSGCGSNSSLGPGGNTISSYRVFNGLLVSNNSTGQPINFTLRQPTAAGLTGISPLRVTAYSQTAAGTVNAYAFENGAASPTLTNTSVELDPNNYYTLMVTGVYQTNGTVTGNEGGNGIIRLYDNPPINQIRDNAGNALQYAAIRIFNGAPNGPPISVTNDTSGTIVPIPGFVSIAYGTASGNTDMTGLTDGYLVLPVSATPYTYTVRANGSNGQALLSLPIGPTPGYAYTIVITGSALTADNVPLTYRVIQDYPRP